MKCPEPGIYEGVPFEEYCQWEAMNPSTLVHGMTSMKHLRAAMDEGSDDTPDLKFGRACHAYMLEPDTFHDQWFVGKRCEKPIASGARKGEPCGKRASFRDDLGQWYCGTHSTGLDEEPNLITADEWGRIQAMAKSVAAHPACRLLRKQGGCEVCVVGEIDGVLCKGRVDKRIPPGGNCPATIVDIKKVQRGKLDTRSLQRSVQNYHYHVKAEMYRRLLEQHDRCNYHFYWIFVEDKPPYDVVVRDADHWRDAGEDAVTDLLSKYRNSLKTGVWHGMSDKFEPLPCPDWITNRVAEVRG